MKSDLGMIYAIGDSHTRSFAFNSNFFPLFVGAGKENNFVTEANTRTLQNNILNVLKKIKDLDFVMFVLGEPDARFYSGQGWYPWDSLTPPDISGYKEKVAESIKRYGSMISDLQREVKFRPIVFNVTPSKRLEQNIVVDHYNTCLEEMCRLNDWPYVFINNDIYSHDENIINEQYYGDTVHMNNKIQPLVEKELIKMGLIEQSDYKTNVDWDHKEVMKQFSFDAQFGCYKLKNT